MIIGGAYQGKLDYAKETFGDGEVFICRVDQAAIDFSKPIVYRLEDFVLACVREGIEARDYLRQNRKELSGKVVIGTDLSQGIVPMEAELRVLREMTGRAMLYLAGEADTVTRVFCGLGQKLK